MIKNEKELKEHNKYLLWYYDVTPYLDIQHAKLINELYDEYFGRYGFPEQKKTAKGKLKAFSKEEQQEQKDDLSRFIKENIMVKFNPQTATASAGFPKGEHVCTIKSAEFRSSSAGAPQIVITLQGTGPQQALTNRYFITENAWSDKNIEQLLNSAFSCGSQINPAIDYQVNEQLAQMMTQQHWTVNVFFDEGDNGYVNAKYFRVKKDAQSAQNVAPNPFDQVDNSNPFGPTTEQPIQGNPFGRDELNAGPVQGQGNAHVAPVQQPQAIQGELPFAENGQTQVPNGGWL